MADPGPDRPAASGAEADTSRNGDLAELRTLLLGPERAELNELGEHIRNRSQRAIDIGEVLPDAILLRAGRDPRLMRALQPLLEEALANSVRKDPRILADAMFPVIARAVRRAVASALQGMIESLNQIVETRISFRSVGWRIEAAKTGKSYGEIALLRSLLFRVEQVFLIHNVTGLLLQHVTADALVVRDPDMISGMLTAIQNFVQDSFGAVDNTLETVRMSDFTIWIQHGPQALLAGVIRGTPPIKVREVFASALESIHQSYAAEIAGFKGDATTLDGARPALQTCLLGQSPPGRRASRWPVYLIAMVLVIALALWAGISIRERQRWDRYVTALREEQGIVITHEERHGANSSISGLRDPLSRDPAQLLAAAGIPAANVSFHWEPYQSLTPRFVALREFTGSKSRLEQQVIHFDIGKFVLLPASRDSLRGVADLVRTVLKAGESVGEKVRIEIIGHTDDQGSAEKNDQLGMDRAAAVKSALQALGVDVRQVYVRSAGSGEPLQAGEIGSIQAENRSVSFRVRAGANP